MMMVTTMMAIMMPATGVEMESKLACLWSCLGLVFVVDRTCLGDVSGVPASLVGRVAIMSLSCI